MSRSCETCRFKVDRWGHYGKSIECHRFPPTIKGDYWRFPTFNLGDGMGGDMWCGEYQLNPTATTTAENDG